MDFKEFPEESDLYKLNSDDVVKKEIDVEENHVQCEPFSVYIKREPSETNCYKSIEYYTLPVVKTEDFKCNMNKKEVSINSNFPRQTCTSADSTTVNEDIPKCSAKTLHNCEICGKNFKHGSSLKNHIMMHLSEKSLEDKNPNQKLHEKNCKQLTILHKSISDVECICGKKFICKYTLSRHIKRVSSEKNIDCEICHDKFFDSFGLRRHMLTHTGEKGFKCEVCNKRFNQKSNLKNHMVTHNGEERSLECEVCGKKFNQKCILKRHLLTHTGENRFKCEICNKRFSHKDILKNHMLTHTDMNTSEFSNTCKS